MRKGGGTEGMPHAVDGITGATITADGVEAMIQMGMKYYEPFLKANN